MSHVAFSNYDLVSWLGTRDSSEQTNGTTSSQTSDDIEYISEMHKKYVLIEIKDDIAHRQKKIEEIKKNTPKHTRLDTTPGIVRIVPRRAHP